MRNKKILFILLLIVIVIISIIIFWAFKNNSNRKKIEKACELFGNEYCNEHEPTIETGWSSYSNCKICGIKKENKKPHSDFIICPNCAEITERCTKCGKLLKNK